MPWSAALSLKLLLQVDERKAAQFEQMVANVNPGDLNLFQLRSRRLRDNPEALLQLCDTVLAEHPGNSNGIYRKAVALAQLGRGEEARALMSIDAFVQISSLPKLQSFIDDEAFRAQLRSEILANQPSMPTRLHMPPATGFERDAFPCLPTRPGLCSCEP